MSRYLHLVLFAHLLPAACQMILPKGLPLAMANWKYIATPVNRTNRDFIPSLDNWELGIVKQEGKSEGKAVLINPMMDEGSVFYSDYDNATLWSETFGQIRPLYVAPSKRLTTKNDDNLRHVEFPHEISLTTRFRTRLVRRVPRLYAEGSSRFYVCKRYVHNIEKLQVFHRTTARLPEGCIDITLCPKCIEGADRGERNLGYCCIDVVNGKCINNDGPVREISEGGIGSDRKGPSLNISAIQEDEENENWMYGSIA
ncbi:hypothetical protein B0J13DRAFT_666611 [Dactylonectria estremocensis]|uniref:Uncharacterized protein n=1 Tax=Dactylonectria estremocensis TaxID=1079267 RepID=A0A9P9J620_9HYPO|nr:hypothetical protein B0J13DRAFT_666611 [Dactylonectria estremocensis]